MTHRKGIVCAGNLIVDLIKTIDRYPSPTMLCTISGMKTGLGGSAASTSAALQILDPSLPVSVIGRVGQDDNGRHIVKTLASLGIDTTGVLVTPEQPTSYTDVFNEAESGRRTFFHARGANALLGLDDLKIGQWEADIFHIGYALLLDSMDAPHPECGTVMAKVLKEVSAQGILTSMDVVSEVGDRFQRVVLPALPYCDLLMINELEAGLIAGIPARDEKGLISQDRIECMGQVLLSKGVKRWVVIHAPEGAWCMGPQEPFHFAPAIALPAGYIKGTVGAGDSFAAGVLLGLYRGVEMRQALRYGNAAAAANLSREDSISGLVSLEEALKLEEKYGVYDLALH